MQRQGTRMALISTEFVRRSVERQQAAAPASRLPWALALPLILALSGALWLVIFRLLALLF